MARVFSQTFCVVGALIEKDGKIALVQELISSGEPDAGKWNQPAGWLNVGEDPIAGAKREVEEEIGDINTDNQKTRFNDISDLKWFLPKEIYAMDKSVLRDMDIKQLVKDYFKGVRYPLSLIRHLVQK